MHEEPVPKRMKVGASSSTRYVKELRRLLEDKRGGRCELDSHADTCVAGANTVVIDYTGKTVNVSPFIEEEYEPLKAIPIATVGTAYDCPRTGRVVVLIINEALYFGDRMQHTLLCPNQLRNFGIKVDEAPRQFDPRSTHSIYIPNEDMTIPLQLNGIISGLVTRKPTDAEAGNFDLHVEITSDEEWDPSSIDFAQAEEEVAATMKVSFVETTDMDVEEEEVLDDVMLNVFQLANMTDIESEQGDNLLDRIVSSVKMRYCVSEPVDWLEDLRKVSEARRVELARHPSAMSRNQSSSVVTPEVLAKRWNVGLTTASRILDTTTQYGVRKIENPVQRRFRTSQPYLRYPVLGGKYYSDTMFATTKSLRGFKCAQLFTDGKGFTRFHPMASKSDAHEALNSWVQTDGIPEHLITDGAGEMTNSKQWMDTTREFRIKQTVTEPYSPWQNRAEQEVKEIKRGIRRLTRRKGSPRRLWCYLGQYVAALRRFSAHEAGRSPHEIVLGWTPDISMWIVYDWYEDVYYLDHDGETKIAKWIGVAEGVGSGNCSWLLSKSSKPIARSTVWSIPEEDRVKPTVIEEISTLTKAINEKIGDKLSNEQMEDGMGGQFPLDFDIFEHEADEDLNEFEQQAEVLGEDTVPDADDYTPEIFDGYLTAEVNMPRNGEYLRAKVVARVQDPNGLPKGKAHFNPILDSREYEVEFDDGTRETYTANLIAENMYSQIDDEGRQFQLMKEIVDHETDRSAILKDDGFFEDNRGRRRPKQTTRGWKLLVEWKDQTTSWVPLKDLKESNPVEVAEYAVANKIVEEPAFAWWVPYVLRKRDRIIKKVSSKYWARTHKFGIRLPKSIKEALMIDEQTGTDFWAKAIEKEMRNVRDAFEFRDDDVVPVGYEEIGLHMIFDVKIGDLQRKARLVANGNTTELPTESTFSTVVTRESVRIFFLLAALNDVEVLSADIQNAYISAPTKERRFARCKLEFGAANTGRPVLIVRALYGMRTSGKAFREHLASTLRDLKFRSCKADPDVWMRAACKADGTEYYEYVLCYVDDILVQSVDPATIMKGIETVFTLKEGSVNKPSLYLGADVKEWYIAESDDPGKPRWAMSSDSYVKNAIKEVESELAQMKEPMQLPKRTSTPLAAGYRPELDMSKPLDGDRQNYYQGLIGVLRWVCELGRLDILMPLSMMSRYLVSAREGHLEQLFHVFGYLKEHDKSTMVFDDTMPEFDERRFRECDWDEYYPGAKESIPGDMPAARGKSVLMSCFVDADHGGCRVTRRSHTGIIIFLNRAPISWFSKRQNTVECSTFGSEFVAMRTAVEMIEGLRYKLRMMGVEMEGACNVFCDNSAVVTNATAPESTLKKKHAAINYHRTREAIAARTIRVAKEDTETNISDLLTKCNPGPRLSVLAGRVLW